MAESKRLAAYRARASAGDEQETDPDEGNLETEGTTPNAALPVDGNLTANQEKEGQQMPEPVALEEREDYKAGLAAGQKAANDRMSAVFAHENTKGREAHAARLLGRSLTTDEITAELEHFAPAASLSEDEQKAAAEEAARVAMADAMAKAGNQNLGAGEDEKPTGRAKAVKRWDKANAAVGRTTQKKEG